jgi:hypothetical protein
MEHKVNCLICFAELEYTDRPVALKCYYCGKEFQASARCRSGHYVCDSCHSLSANEVIAQACINSTSPDPLALAVGLMKHPAVHMHGPEHHFMVPAVLLAAYYNLKGDAATKEEKIKLALQRAVNVLGGFCGFYGSCGAGVGTGIFISVITGATPLSGKEWRLANTMTSRSLLAIANAGGPRCCKRCTFIAINEAVNFLRENFDISLPVSTSVKCEFSQMNKECIRKACQFYKG